MRHTRSRSARRRKPHILLAVPTIWRTPGDTRAKTRAEIPPTVYTYSYHTHTPKFIYIYTHTQQVRGAHTQYKHTYKHPHTHTIQIILYTQKHIYIKYTYTNMHIYIIVIHGNVNAHISILLYISILLTETTAAQNEVALGYHRLRGLYSPAVVFATTIYTKIKSKFKTKKNLYTIHCVQLSQSILVQLSITLSMQLLSKSLCIVSLSEPAYSHSQSLKLTCSFTHSLSIPFLSLSTGFLYVTLSTTIFQKALHIFTFKYTFF